MRDSACPRVELFRGGGSASAEFFRHSVAAHGAPFVMVTFQPNLKQVVELAVFRNVLRGNMAVIVENRLVFGVFVIKLARGLRAEQKIIVDEGHRVYFQIQAGTASRRCEGFSC